MPCCAACCSAPRATSVKNGLRTSSRMKPIELLLPALSCRAASLRTKPSWSIAARTRSRVAGATFSGRFKTLETVPRATPARSATSRMLTWGTNEIMA